MKPANPRRPKVKGARKPYKVKVGITPMGKSIRAYMKRLRKGAR